MKRCAFEHTFECVVLRTKKVCCSNTPNLRVQHVSSISGKASKVLGLIKRNLWNCPRSVKETTYTTLVRPKLEYGCEARDPHFKKDISSLERVQRKAARFCSNNYQPTDSVTGMLRDLGWFSLETRRTIATLNLMYKICHGTVDIDKNSYLRPHSNCRVKTRCSHDYKFFNINATKDVYFYSFFPRTLSTFLSTLLSDFSIQVIFTFIYSLTYLFIFSLHV